MIDWIAHPALTALSKALLHSLWQFVLLIGLLHVVAQSYGNARSKHRIYFIALLLCPIIFVSTFCWFYPANTATLIAQPELMITLTEGILTNKVAMSAVRPIVPQLLSLFYLLVLLLLICKSVLDIAKLRAVRHKSVMAAPELQRTFQRLQERFTLPQHIALRLSSQVGSALTAGVFRPFIVLPLGVINQLSPAEMEAILLHELAHLARRDHLWNAIQVAVLQLFFYHPLVHWLCHRLDREREYACDDLVVAHINPQLYAHSLLHLARFSITYKNQFTMQAQGKTQFTQRIQRLFSPSSRPSSKQRWLLLPLLLLPMLFTAALTAQQKTEPVIETIVEEPAETQESILYFFDGKRYDSYKGFAHLLTGSKNYMNACGLEDEELQRINAAEGRNFSKVYRFYSSGVPVDKIGLKPGEPKTFESVPATVEEEVVESKPESKQYAIMIDEVPVYSEPVGESPVTFRADYVTSHERVHPVFKVKAEKRNEVDYDGTIVLHTVPKGEAVTENATAAINFTDSILVIVNGQPYPDRSLLDKIDPEKIESVSVIKGEAMKKRLGDKAKLYRGIVDVKLKGSHLPTEPTENKGIAVAIKDIGNVLYIINEKVYTYDQNAINQLPPDAIKSVKVDKTAETLAKHGNELEGVIWLQLKAGHDPADYLKGISSGKIVNGKKQKANN